MRILFLLIIFFTGFASAQEARLAVVTESSPPFHYVDEHGHIVGKATDRVRQIIDVAGLKADFALYPWARTITLAEKNADTLIFSIARTPERENKFHWIARVSEFRLSVVGQKGNGLSGRKLTPATLGRFTFAVQRDDIAHKWLIDKGFVEGKNMMVCADIQCSWNFLIRGTVDFIIEDPSLIAPMASRLNVDSEQLIMVSDIPELALTGYLAASLKTDKATVQRLKDAAQQLGLDITSDDVNVARQ